MKIDRCLILAAGFGTRMGPIGERLPKVLWPIFEKPLLHLQILYAKSLGVNQIYINLFHQKDQIKSFIYSLNDPQVKILEEAPQILDIGGGVHNLARQAEVDYQGNLLILNSDQFLLFPTHFMEEALKKLQNHDACLFGIEVEKTGKYNQTLVSSNGYLEKIIPLNDVTVEKYWTYSGISLVNLARLKKSTGPSPFFESVAPFQRLPIPFIGLSEISYWDFGTKERYHRSMFNLLNLIAKKHYDVFIEFLLKEKSLELDWLKSDSYHSLSSGVIDLDGGETLASSGSIIIKKPISRLIEDKSFLVYGDRLDEV